MQASVLIRKKVHKSKANTAAEAEVVLRIANLDNKLTQFPSIQTYIGQIKHWNRGLCLGMHDKFIGQSYKHNKATFLSLMTLMQCQQMAGE